MENLGAKIPEIVLNSGRKMPVMGFGSAAYPLLPLEEQIRVFMEAMENGYRHFDTASCYETEEALGKAVGNALEIGLINNRDELFITSKLWTFDAHPDLVLPAIRTTLCKLGLEYLDLYLIHWPVRLKQGANMMNLAEGELLPFDIQGTWKAMEDCCNLGLTKSIGVSNFSCEKIQKILQISTIPPAINQVEMNVGWQQRKLLPFCSQKGIRVCAWSPLGGYGTMWGSNQVMENQLLEDIAASKNKTLPQVALRWIYEEGAIPIVKSFNKERMKQNLQIFDWELTKEEKDQILQIPQRRVFRAEYFTQPNGPIKSVQELWDGDL